MASFTPTSRRPVIGDKIYLTDAELESQAATVPIIKAIAVHGYLTVSETFEYLPGKYVVCVAEDPNETHGFVNYTLL
jgi:hypothetical protein